MKNFLSICKNNFIDSISIGKFDGMHLAHQKLISLLSEEGILLSVEYKKYNRALTPNKELFTGHKIYSLPIDEVRDMNADEFLTTLSIYLPKLQKIVVGYDFRFGKDRKYCANDLRDKFWGEVVIVPMVSVNGVGVHSKNIIEYLECGDIKNANDMLGRQYYIEGDVVGGQGIGSKLIYPTININSSDFILPKDGVYATKVVVDGKEHNSVTFLGYRASLDGQYSIESHLIDSEISFIGDRIGIYFVQRIRDNKKFDSLGELKGQISLDIRESRLILQS